MQPDDDFEEFEIDLAPIWPAEDARLEPIFLDEPPWFEFEEVERLEPELDEVTAQEAPVEFAVFAQLEPERTPLEEDEPPHVRLASRQSASAGGLLGSLGVHALPLVFLIIWSNSPSQIGGAIPVQLVIEESRPPLEETPPTPLAAETTSEKVPDADAGGASAAAPPPPPKPPTRKQIAAAAPRPVKPKPPPRPVTEPKPRQPTVPAQPVVAAPFPPVTGRTEASQHQAREARAGPGLDRSNYFSRLVVLTRPHFHLLPASFLAGRRGRTILTLVVREDGEVERIVLKRGSGYPDIDARVQQMVAAVGRFPPLPPSFRSPSVELDFDLLFPDGLQ